MQGVIKDIIEPKLQDALREKEGGTLSKTSILSEENPPSAPEKNYINAIKLIENSNLVGLKDGFWSPHKSPEGGTDTIGFGHKLSKAEHEGGYLEHEGKRYSLEAGVPSDVIKDVLEKDINKSVAKAKSDVNKFKPEGLTWEELPEKYKLVLTDIAFNAGSLVDNQKFVWKKLLKAMSEGDDKAVRKESVTSFSGGKLLTRAKKRNNAIGIK